MANRLYNKQVSPKGYKAGGRAGKMGGGMMKRTMLKDGTKLKMVTKNGKKVPFFAADGKGSKDLGKAAGAGAAAAKLGKTAGAGLTGSKLKKLNPGLRSFMQKKMKNK